MSIILKAILGFLRNKYVASGLAILAVAFGIWSGGWNDGFAKGIGSIDIIKIKKDSYDDGYRKGQISRDLEWQTKLAEAQRKAMEQADEWQRKFDAMEVEKPVPTTSAELLKLCQEDPLCRK